MKKRLPITLLAISMALSIIACGKTAKETDSSSRESILEPIESPRPVDNKPTESKEPSVDDDVAARNESIKPYLTEYLAESYQADTCTFQSSVTDIYLYSPQFAVTDVNNDGYTDVVVWGDTGIRNHQITEVYSFDPSSGAFFANILDGYITGLSNGCLLLEYSDYDTAAPVYYDDIYVCELSFAKAKEIVAQRTVTEYDENGNETVTTSYFVRGKEASFEEYNKVYTAYKDAATASPEFTDTWQ